jgi:hypothetical protein
MPEAKKTERNTVGFICPPLISLDKDVHAELIKRKKETGKSLHTLVRELVFPAEAENG